MINISVNGKLSFYFFPYILVTTVRRYEFGKFTLLMVTHRC